MVAARLSFKRILLINLPTIIDIEASGFGPHSYPIEVGVVRQDGNRFCKLIKPFEDWTYWDQEAEKVHGISHSLLTKTGISGVQACLELNAFLASSEVYCDGWVVDLPWINKLFSRAGISMSFRVSSLEMILKSHQMERWHQSKEQAIEILKLSRHRASNDALIIQKTFELTY
ncbi:3'-5' exonuclease [Glaciecola petra]|uniref:3'-5' exoribonuclease n=1 Tax=Glaciecola petra TaxID=3075602 RepID=A0ABU2ZLD4_9ALTE|nr:3'-5' exoribonuclease [Aestuariibacter sp. P117]MDT0593444.1 3'-5' exoribonuclease [Aestuariibacter sp. P117]